MNLQTLKEVVDKATEFALSQECNPKDINVDGYLQSFRYGCINKNGSMIVFATAEFDTYAQNHNSFNSSLINSTNRQR